MTIIHSDGDVLLLLHPSNHSDEVPGKGVCYPSRPLGRRLVAPDLAQPAEAALATPLHWMRVEICVYMTINSPLTGPPQHTSAIWSYLQREGYSLRALTSTVQIYCQ